MDSFARLLECNAVCAAVYLDVKNKKLWLANNKVHETSNEHNQFIEKMHIVFKLVSNEKLSIIEIISQLKDIIAINLKPNLRYDLTTLTNANINIAAYVESWLNELFQSGCSSKDWLASSSNELEHDNPQIRTILLKAMERTVKLAKDFLKLRDYLLATDNNDEIKEGILFAIKKNSFCIIHADNKDVHAEMRIISQMTNSNTRRNPYVAISKLCCGHCALAIKALGIETRGTHGKGYNWMLPKFIEDNPDKLQKYLGEKAYECYEQLPPIKKASAKQFLQSKESNPNNRQVRMDADSSESDIDFGPDLSDEDKVLELEEYQLAEVWKIRNIRRYHQKEWEFLCDIDQGLNKILDLYNSKDDKFSALTDSKVRDLISDVARSEDTLKSDIFEKMSELFDENQKLFWMIVNDEYDTVLEYGLDEFIASYNAKINNIGFNSDEEEEAYDEDTSAYHDGEPIESICYSEVRGELEEENGWGYDYNSDDSSNRWGYRSD